MATLNIWIQRTHDVGRQPKEREDAAGCERVMKIRARYTVCSKAQPQSAVLKRSLKTH